MKKGWRRPLAIGLIGGTLAAFFIDFNKSEYIIDENKVQEGDAILSFTKEYKGNNEIKYFDGINNEVLRVVVNGKKYYRNDTLIFEEAQKRYNYLQGKIDSIEQAKKESKLQKKLNKKQNEIEEALEVLRK